MWILRAYDTDTDELEREFTLPEGFTRRTKSACRQR
jgi:hypothetical protein